MAVESFGGLTSALSICLPVHINGYPLTYVVNGADAIDTLLPLAVSTVAALHRVGRRGRQGINKEGQGLFNVGREEFPERCSDGNEGTSDSAAKSGEFFQRCLRTTASERG